MMWFRRIKGFGFRKNFYIPITWQGFVFDAIQYGLYIVVMIFMRGYSALLLMIVIYLIALGVKKSLSKELGVVNE